MLERPSERTERWVFVAILLAVLGLFVAELLREYEPAKLSGLFFIAFWAPLLVVHEVGHAVVARLFGWSVDRVVMGFGRTLWRTHVGGAEVEFKWLPVEGFVQLCPPAGRPGTRLAAAVIYFAGVGFELVVAGVVIALLGWETLTTRTDHVGIIAAQTLCICVAVGGLFNLVPHAQDGRVNDGLGIVRALFQSRTP